MSKELNSLLEKHKQLQGRSVFKTRYEPSEKQFNHSHCVHPQSSQNFQNPVYFISPENWGYPMTHLPSQYLHIPPYYSDGFIQTPSLIYPQYSNIPSVPMTQSPPPLPPHLPPPPPPPPLSPPQSTSSKVYVNPNYNRKMVLTDPSLTSKPSIYVNPKLMHHVINPKLEKSAKNKFVNNIEQEKKKFINTPECADTNFKSFSKQKNSLYTNVIDSLNTVTDKDSEITVIDLDEKYEKPSSAPLKKSYNVKPETIIVKSDDLEENKNSGLLLVSQRKLVRVPKNSKPSTSIKNPIKRKSVSDLKKTRNSPKKYMLHTASQISKVDNSNCAKVTWYHNSNSMQKKKTSPKKVSNLNGLVSIGGVVYKSSRNQLVRESPNILSITRETNLCDKIDQRYDAETGAELIEVYLPENKNEYRFNSTEKLNNTVQSAKNNLSNKVKQRYIQILRKKSKKNNQLCLFFQRYGYCANQQSCSKIHDKNQVVCKNFLQGMCLLENCPLSHTIGPEKMPTCKYFLDGCCTRDECPYQHVKVASKNPICLDFTKGYCPRGDECLKRHIYACPEFDKSGKCCKGKYCPYPHKSLLFKNFKNYKKSSRRKSHTFKAKQSNSQSTKLNTQECRNRYYENLNEDLSQKKEKLLKSVKLMKNVHLAKLSNDSDTLHSGFEESSNEAEKCKEKIEAVINRPKRSPIGLLPAYIPIG